MTKMPQMEVLVDSWGYTITIDYGLHMDILRRGNVLRGEILGAKEGRVDYVSTGKYLTLRVDPSLRHGETKMIYHPDDADWNGIRRVDVRISPSELDELETGRGKLHRKFGGGDLFIQERFVA